MKKIWHNRECVCSHLSGKYPSAWCCEKIKAVPFSRVLVENAV